jgi:MscS family membrane protein
MRDSLFLLLMIGLVLLSGCGGVDTAMPTEPGLPSTPTQTAALTPAPTQTATPTPTLTASPTASPPAETGTAEAEPGGGGLSGLGGLVPALVDIVPTRTPVPTATPDALTESIRKIVQETGLSGRTVLRLQYADWINLAISLLYVLVAFLVGTWLIRWLFPRLVRRTQTVLDDRLLQVSGNELRWLAVVIILRLATNRLTFVDADAKTFLGDVYFSLSLILAVMIAWRLIGLAAQQGLDRAKRRGRRKEEESLISLSVWAARLVVIITAVSFTLAHFGSNVTGLAVFLAIVGLAFSLAGRDILADIVSGAVIFIDRPYRIGDRIALPKIDSWGDVVDIGMRSTRILTLNNRLVIVPNSQIGKDQIINYSYPDPSYYDSTDVVVAYDNDPEQVGKLLVDAVRSVEGVQKERDIDALLMKFTENQMVFLVGWWIATYDDFYPVHDRVSRAVIRALREAGIILPYTKSRVHVEGNPRE